MDNNNKDFNDLPLHLRLKKGLEEITIEEESKVDFDKVAESLKTRNETTYKNIKTTK
jgi:hypothetical protein